MNSTAKVDPVKVLTVGSAVGSIREIFAKIKTIDAKHGKFDFALCTGDFFGPLKEPSEEETVDNDVSQLLEGRIEAPMRCYIMQGNHPLPERIIQKFAKTGGELCKDVFLMNKSGIITTAHGLRIACLGGIHDSSIYSSSEAAPGFTSPYFTSQTVDRLLSNTLTKTTPQNQNYKSLAAIRDAAAHSQLIDILISHVWPESIAQFSAAPLPPLDISSTVAFPLDDVIRRTKPRYHFAAGGGQPPMFWEREPFIWDDEEGRVSRFVSLGSFGGEPTVGKKQRWFYAFSITPNLPASQAAAAPRPANATKNPFTAVARPPKRAIEETEGGENFIWGSVRQPVKRTRVAQGEPGKPPPGYKCRRCESTEHYLNDCPERAKPPEGYVCKICNTPGHFVRDCPTKDAVGDTGGRKPREGYICRACGSDAHHINDCPVANQRPSGGDQHGGRGKRGPPKEIGPDECWFCLSNPNLAKHLIVSIGVECYVSLPKGQIVPPDEAAVPGGGHVLIIPISHHPTYSTIPPDLAPSILEETDKYKSALRAYYAKHGNVPVFFEVGRLSTKGGHAHVQSVPIPMKLRDDVEKAFLHEGRMQGIDFEGEPDAALEACAGGRGGYFRVDLPDGRKMVHLIKDNIPFGIQFGRQALVTLLNKPERLDWKTCMLTEEEDKEQAQAFKTAFAPFDLSL